MPSMDDHQSNSVVKMIVAADSGAGKTGALASLVDAGFHLRILDFDNGLSPLKHYVKDKSKLRNVRFSTLIDELRLMGGRMSIHKATAFQRAMTLLEKGGGDWGEDVGPPTTWGPRDILVIDTLGKLGKASMNLVLQVNNHLTKPPEIQHYGTAMDNIERMLSQLIHPVLMPCHVIINTHLTKDEGSPKLYPESLGSKLNPKIARDFDNYFSISMSGPQRTIKTKKDGLLALKCAKPLKDEYTIEDGYAKIFQELTGVAKLSDLWERAPVAESAGS